MTTTHDIALLMAAIDAGDDSALPILADALEEAGDARAAGLRRVGGNRPGMWGPYAWCWKCLSGIPKHPAHVADEVFDRLCVHAADEVFDRLCAPGHRATTYVCAYPSRSAAFLALAEAIS